VNTRRLLLSPLWFLIALTAMLALNASSAAAAGGLETRVRAFDHPTANAVEQPSSETAGGVGCVRPVSVGMASGSCVATNTVDDFAGIKPGSSGGPSAGKPFSQAVRQEELANNPSTCVYCHMETSAPQVDHVIPRVQGGNATIENAQTTCGWCNASKGGRSFPVNPPPGYEGMWPPPWWNQGG
jgi:hypothetical protein